MNKIKNQVAIKRIFTVYFGTIIAKIIPMATDKIFAINDVLVRDEIVEIPFSCDLKKCKGACCTLESELGAPVTKAEVEEIEKILPVIKEYLKQTNIDEIEEKGFFEIKDDEMMITSVNNRDCVFSFWDNGIAKCAIERAYFDGKVQFSECAPALEKGKEENITIVEFCKDSLIRLYGEDWYNKLMNYSGR